MLRIKTNYTGQQSCDESWQLSRWVNASIERPRCKREKLASGWFVAAFMRLQKRLLQIALIRGGLVDDAAAVTAGVSRRNDAASAIRFNAKLNYAETDRDAPHCFTMNQKSRAKHIAGKKSVRKGNPYA